MASTPEMDKLNEPCYGLPLKMEALTPLDHICTELKGGFTSQNGGINTSVVMTVDIDCGGFTSQNGGINTGCLKHYPEIGVDLPLKMEASTPYENL